VTESLSCLIKTTPRTGQVRKGLGTSDEFIPHARLCQSARERPGQADQPAEGTGSPNSTLKAW